jgi:hypothetical protein
MFLAVLAASAKHAGNLTDARATPPRDGRMVVQTSRRDRSFDGAFDPLLSFERVKTGRPPTVGTATCRQSSVVPDSGLSANYHRPTR